jgi:hypothetical protein
MLLVAVVAMGCVVVSSASAFSSNPLFVPANNQTVRGEGGTSVLKSPGAGIEISCTENHVVSGNVSNGLLIGGVVLHYLGCTVTKGEEISGCPANSVEAPEGLILTKTLHGILGLELPANATVVVFLPVTGTEFVKFAETKKEGKKCNPPTAVTGQVAALVSPIGVPTVKGSVVTDPKPTAVHLTHNLGLITAKLVAFTVTSELEQSDSVTFGEPTEVT